MRIRKDAFVRLFNEPDFLSKDRTKRFVSKKKVDEVQPYDGKEVKKHNIISISDWIVVKGFDGVACVLEFKDNKAKTIAQGRIKVSAVDITNQMYVTVGMLLQYFVVDENGKLSSANVSKINDASFISIKNYKLHIPTPEIHNNIKFLESNVLTQLSQHIIIDPTDTGFSKNYSQVTQTNKLKPKAKKKKKKEQCSTEDDSDLEALALQNIKKRKR